VKFRVPAGIWWPAHRIAVSGRYHDSLHTIMSEWSLADVVQVNELLDAIEAAEAEARDG
jgi:hypothetical protein